MTDPREALHYWALMTAAQRQEAAEAMRPGMVEMCVRRLGARDHDEVRDALEMIVAGCQAELDAATPSPLPPTPNRAERRAGRRRR